MAGKRAVEVFRAAAGAAGSPRSACIKADSLFQSESPSIFDTSSRLSLWLMVMALWLRDSRSACAIAFASRKSRIGCSPLLERTRRVRWLRC